MRGSLYGREVYVDGIHIGNKPEESFIYKAYFIDTGEYLNDEEISVFQYIYSKELDDAHYQALEERLHEQT